MQVLCNQNRISGAIKESGVWLIPFSAKKPERLKAGKKVMATRQLRVLSLFSGFVNPKVNVAWDIDQVDKRWTHLGKTIFHTVFANDIKPEAKAAWANYFSAKGIDAGNYYLDSIVDLVKLQRENKINIFPKNIDVLIGGFPCQDFSVSGKRMGFDSGKGHDVNTGMEDRMKCWIDLVVRAAGTENFNVWQFLEDLFDDGKKA